MKVIKVNNLREIKGKRLHVVTCDDVKRAVRRFEHVYGKKPKVVYDTPNGFCMVVE